MMPFVPFSRARRPVALDETTVLVARLAAGDAEVVAEVLAELYRREAAPVYRYAVALCGNPGWAADATQEAFVALASRPRAYDAGRATLGAYLAGVARHALLAQWRAGAATQPLPEDEEAGPQDGDAAASPETLLLRRQGSAEVWAALRRLPVPFREALVLVDLQERPYAEAARIAGIELNTLRTRVHRARARLAALLGGAAGRPA